MNCYSLMSIFERSSFNALIRSFDTTFLFVKLNFKVRLVERQFEGNHSPGMCLKSINFQCEF